MPPPDRPAIRFLDRSTPPHILTLVLVAGVPALSLNIFLPSLPSMARHFDVEYHLIQLSMSLYLAMTAVVQLMIGPLADRYGRRSVLLLVTAIFVVASIGTVLAPGYVSFMICRMAQAAIAVGFVLSRAIVRDMVAEDQAASMIGYVTMGMSVVPMAGPVIGGALDEVFGWQATFVLLALSGAGLFALIWADLGETGQRRQTSFLDQAREYPALFRSQRFWGYCLAATFASGAFFSYLGGAPFVGSEIFGLSPAALGIYFGAPAVGYMAGNFLSGLYSVRVGLNRMMLAGALVTLAGMTVLALVTLAGFVTPLIFFGFTGLIGFGNGILLPSANAGMLSVRPALAASAAGIGGALLIGLGAALSAMAGAVLTPTSGPMPLILLMLVTSALSLACAIWVILRARAVTRQ
ncbi:DHA1 family bicyclomycin/chloramphenicol resistance-like MFS transporter [Defluviimonas denitrificans]|jgi:DHA1 family bicyclomycin/chloramphenicol resistance-like MFS transporter|uniref:Bcr/CflA family efflux transporter n=1 Tax=Albidovulum denitrificans TaxID=404881 RepID=A0A2S8SEA0_9RHOB|nr:multidrug effflux MFS transporter [Defluviimonas denitrificans]PQV59181.1 DHA1 family bicyclomycin/chloramphenicol resistance-like MFS transporter [Defluviimonas denitrificans]